MPTTEKVPMVYEAIAAVAGDLAQIGIAKTNENKQYVYKFRGIDDVLNALAPLLVKHGLLILPKCINRDVVERTTKTGGNLIYVTVEVDFVFLSVKDGSSHIVTMYGEAMDAGDKATNKAMSAAYKYAAFQAFCIPVAGEDADATIPEPSVPAKKEPEQAKQENPPPAPAMATRAQLDAIKGLWLGDKDGLYRLLSEVCGRSITGGKELTLAEANAVINKLGETK